jgi:hypothetical protein
MRVLLINIDSTIPNLALAKIEKYHKDRGDEVFYDLPMMACACDKIYVSCIFKENRHLCDEWLMYPNASIGGSGYSLSIVLPEEIEQIKPRINLGFTTRGCIRNCYFCIVPKKEGKIHSVGDIYDIWDGKAKEITLMDNNILALPDHFFKISQQLKDEKLRVDFNQGLDFRLLTDDICKELFSLKHTKEIRFAFDDIAYKSRVLKALDMLKHNGLKDWQTRWYLYVGVKDTFDTVYERCKILHENKQLIYMMRDRDKSVQQNKKFIALAKWTNWACFFKYDFFDVLRVSDHFSDYRPYFDVSVDKEICTDLFDRKAL